MISKLKTIHHAKVDERLTSATTRVIGGIKDEQSYWKEVGRIAGLVEAKEIFEESIKRFDTEED